ncbi:MAG TPA: hypothetical protein PL157_07025, partial [Acidobacteriota bacterium]|nr:hypothetical protein [Acidobacteriota bacterium]
APAGGSTTSTQFNNPGSGTAIFTPNPAVTGSYTLRWTISSNSGLCTPTTDDVVITFAAAPTTSNSGPDQVLCPGSPATLAANSPTIGTGLWSVQAAPAGGSASSAQFNDPTSPTAIFTPNPAVAGNYALRWTISNPPCSASSDALTIAYDATPPTPANAGPDQTVCNFSIAFMAANFPASGNGSWSVVTVPAGGSTSSAQFDDPTSPSAFFIADPYVFGNYTLRWTISAGCTSSTDDVVVTFVGPPTGADAGPDQTLCVGSPATLAGNTPTSGIGTWTVLTAPGGGSTSPAQFSDRNLPNAIFTPNPAVTGGYVLAWTIGTVCFSGSDLLTITYQTAPTTANAGPDQTVCVASPGTMLAANTPTNGSGTWSVVTAPSGGSTTSTQFSNPGAATAIFTANPAVAGNYTLRWSISNSLCPASTDDVVMTYLAPPTTATVGGAQTICINGTTTGLGGNIPINGTGMWSVVGGGTGTFSPNATTPNATFTHTGGGGPIMVSWTISNSPCTASSATVTITISQPPTTATVGGPQTICVNGTTTSLGGNAPSNGTGQWSVVSGGTGNFSSATDPNATFTHTGGSGPITVRWTISNGICVDSSATTTITMTQPPTTATVGGPQTICGNGTTTGLGGNIPVNGTGNWSVVSGGTGTFSPNSAAPNAAFTHTGGAGPVVVRWTISNAPCTPDSRADVTITITTGPTTATVGGPQTICTGGTTAGLGGNPPTNGTGSWSVVSGGTGNFLPNATTPNAMFQHTSGAGPVMVQWTISNGFCPDSSATVAISITQSPSIATVGGPQTICARTTTGGLGGNPPVIGSGNWSVVSGGTGTFAPNATTPNATFTHTGGVGPMTLRWTISNSPCLDSTAEVTITVNPAATVNAGPDQGICRENPVATLAASLGGGATSGTWTGGAGSFAPNNTAPNATYTPTAGEIAAGTVTLTYTTNDPVGPCSAISDEVTITITSCLGLMVADTTNNRIQAFDGVSWNVIGVGTVGSGDGQFRLPEAVTFDGDGRIYVADTGNNRIQWSTDSGITWANFATFGTGLNQVKAPQGVALDSAGNLYVSDTGNGRVVRFNSGVPGTGVMIASNGTASGQVGSPRGLTIDATFRLFITDESNSRILRISNANTTVSATSGAMIATLGTALNKVKNPQGIAIDGNGTLFVADTGNSRILRWINANPNNATTLALTGSSLGQVNQPEGVTITQFVTGPLAGSPLLVVGDTANNRIQGRPLPTGGWTLIGAPNGIGSGVGQFRSPSKIR